MSKIMKKWILIISSASVVGLLIVGVFVIKAFGSNDSISIAGCDPYNVEISKGNNDNSVIISWTTKNDCSAYVIYGENMKDLSLVAVDADHSVNTKSHSVVINTLLSTKMYYFTIVSDGTNYGKNGLAIPFSISSL